MAEAVSIRFEAVDDVTSVVQRINQRVVHMEQNIALQIEQIHQRKNRKLAQLAEKLGHDSKSYHDKEIRLVQHTQDRIQQIKERAALRSRQLEERELARHKEALTGFSKTLGNIFGSIGGGTRGFLRGSAMVGVCSSLGDYVDDSARCSPFFSRKVAGRSTDFCNRG